jgi:elongation factor Ts
MSIAAKLVMELRAKTNAGMMDCKKALTECNGNLDDAIQYLREKGILKAAKKAERVAAEGLVFDIVSDDEKKGLILEINSETDFVAKNESFQMLGNKIANFLLQNDITSVEDLNQCKLENVTIHEHLADLIAKIGENIAIRRFAKEISDSFITTYIHMGGKIGVIVNFSGEPSDENKAKGKDIAMHIAAMAPDFLNESDVPDDVLEKEKNILKAQLLEEGKAEQIIDKILVGKIQKFYEDNCLIHQKFVKDDKISVKEYVGKLAIRSFTRYKLGEGIEKEQKDFASEVAAQIKG